ncbi:MAG: ABC transporter permease [Chitinophaga sp.]|uniref:ABC transporter permease n=1 Tax=Chitinophaga sp. TaxID=1869181 RepID=UPI0025B9DE32|nr:ABC transporter permease [Chitinophaga sp.]MBV8253418.1 ABC transporter permease [Chitinophaga sp.]
MLVNYLKVAWRHLRQNKVLSFINIFGLATGMAFALLVYMWVHYERSFDTFHTNKDRIAMVMRNVQYNGVKSTFAATPLPLYQELKNSFPEVQYAVRNSWPQEHSLLVKDNKFRKNGMFVDPDFLHMFSFPLLSGNSATALKEQNSIIISATTAKSLFGSLDAVGKTLRLDNTYDMLITGVIQDVPENSSVNFDFLVNFDFYAAQQKFNERGMSWGDNILLNIVQLREGTSMATFTEKVERILAQKSPETKDQFFTVQPLTRWHLYSDYVNWKNVGGRITYVQLFMLVGIFVLLVACMNFMNLTTARSEKRSREVGVRKSAGSTRKQLFLQFMVESLLTSVLAFFIAILLLVLIYPFIRDLGFEHIHGNAFNLRLLAVMLLVCIATGFISGIYPAVYLSAFKPIAVLKGSWRPAGGAAWFRRILVVTQFSISCILIICTIIIFQQVRYGQQRNPGYNAMNLINVQASDDLRKNYDALKNELMETNVLESVARSSQPMTTLYNSWSDFKWEGKDPTANIALDVIMTDFDFEKTVGLQFTKGHAFRRNYSTDSSGVIINEAAAKILGFQDPLGKTIAEGDRRWTILGVVKDVILTDPFKPISPLVFLFNTDHPNAVLLRLKPNVNTAVALNTLRPIFEKYDPSLPFAYTFTDQEFAKKFDTEKQAGKLAVIFSVLAILISCLGLFGLAMYMAERRTREIGIRKTLGASVVNLWILLSKEFIWMVLLACTIASPIALWMMSNWLKKYDFHVSISPAVFIGTGALALLIAIATVSTQSVKAALTNPVKNLKTE